MRVNKVQNNNVSFGIKYVNKASWNPDVLKAFENSKLLKEIDQKYREASVRCVKLSSEESLINSDMIHTLFFDIRLTKDKIYKWDLSSHQEFAPENELVRTIKSLSLKNIEQEAINDSKPLIKPKEKRWNNPIVAFFSKLFS